MSSLLRRKSAPALAGPVQRREPARHEAPAAALEPGLLGMVATSQTPVLDLFASNLDQDTTYGWSEDLDEEGPEPVAWSEIAPAATAAIRDAGLRFSQQATVREDRTFVDAPVCVGQPGWLTGPNMAQLVRNAPVWADWTGERAEIRDAIANAFGEAFEAWRAACTISGLPMFPTLMVVPGPFAPPLPGIPFALGTMPSTGTSRMMQLPTKLLQALGPAAAGQEAAVEAWAGGAVAGFMTWLQRVQVLLTGTGPVLAAPFVNLGPVKGGRASGRLTPQPLL